MQSSIKYSGQIQFYIFFYEDKKSHCKVPFLDTSDDEKSDLKITRSFFMVYSNWEEGS